MSHSYTVIDAALRWLNRESAIAEFHRRKVSDVVMEMVVRDPINLILLEPIVPNGEDREWILATYIYIRRENSIGRGAARTRVNEGPLATRPARSQAESKRQVKGVEANRTKRRRGS